MVHLYAGYYGYSASIGGVINLIMDTDFTLAQAKKIFVTNMMNSEFLAEYGGRNFSGSTLYYDISKLVTTVYVIGDAKEPRQFIDSIREGFYTSYSL